MHLPKLPTIFVKGGEERKAYFTVQARELIADGWVEQGTEKPAPVAPEPVVEEPVVEEVVAEEPVEEKPKATRKRTTKKVEE